LESGGRHLARPFRAAQSFAKREFGELGLSHLHALWYEGKMKRFQDEAGVWRFQTVSN
jgi:hypothetical protein